INYWCNFLLSDSYFKEEFSQILYDYAVTKTLFDYYAFWPHYEILIETKQKMESLLGDIINDITIETKDGIYSFLTASFRKKGFYWQFARKLFDMKFIEISKARDIKKSKKSFNEFIPNTKINAQVNKAECYVDDGANVLGDAENVSNIISEKPGRPSTADDNISLAQTEQSNAKVNPELSPKTKSTEINTVHKNNTKDEDQLSYVAEKINSVIKPGPKQSKPASEPKVFESKPEQTNFESKLEQSKTKSHQSKCDGLGSISPSDHDEVQSSIGKSEHQDQLQWETLLGFSCIQEVISNNGYYFNLQ
ncbi:jg22434, partial [Pararge aegeria aegeria]